MWQYYKAVLVNETSIDVIVPEGWKMMEHSYYGNTAMSRVEYLLKKQSACVMRIWDYASVAPFVWTHKFEEEDMFHRDDNDYDWLLNRDEWKNYYLVNLSKKEFINMKKQNNEQKLKDQFWRVVHPLPLLCRAETEEAWWDYHSEQWQEYIWNWCWDRITVYEDIRELDEYFEQNSYRDMTDIYMFKE